MSDDCYYLADQQIRLDKSEAKQKLTQRLRQYLELRNVSILVGNGCSIPLGAPVITNTQSLRPELQIDPHKLIGDQEQTKALRLLDLLLPNDTSRVTVEAILGVLSSIMSNAQTLPTGTTFKINDQGVTANDAQLLDRLLKKWLYHRCKKASDPPAAGLRDHQELLKRVLLRSTTLPRCKLFTTNYDLIIEHALDGLGVVYLDGFIGTTKRSLNTASYHSDLYYPGETTQGNVSRVDRVLHLYKVHGSINWQRHRSSGTSFAVTVNNTNPDEERFGNVMVYPSPLKANETHGYPYSEMFRHFSASINQPQSVLITLGYSFQDDHINLLIYQALNVPSFVLVIVVPEFPVPANNSPAPEHEVWRLIHHVKSPRIMVITGGKKENGGYITGAGTLRGFATEFMPDITELDIQARVDEEVRRVSNPAQEGPSAN